MNSLVLRSLDGSNPLGLMAALGVLEIVSDRGIPAQLRWRDEGIWLPVVSGCAATIEELIAWIDEDRRDCASDTALGLEYDGKHDLKPAPLVFRQYLQELVCESAPESRRSVDWGSAFATDGIVDNKGNTKPTALHFAAGQQQFLKMIADLVSEVTPEDLHEALVGPWRYQRPLPVMAWDATMARDYALRASNPSSDKKLGVPGADWLGVRGLPSLPVVPIGTRLHTTGCTGGWKNSSFTWPLWTAPLTRDMVRTTLRLDVAAISPTDRVARGIGVVFRSRIKRSDQGGYGSFTPASVV